MKPAILILAFAALAACGVDGAPVRPVANAGVSVGTSGVSARARVGLRKGPLGVSIGL